MKTITFPQKSAWKSIISRPVADSSTLLAKVKSVLEEVQQQGDAAVQKYTLQFDGVSLTQLSVTEEELQEAVESLDKDLKKAIESAADNIRTFHRSEEHTSELQ